MKNMKKMDWKQVSAEYIIRRPWLTVRRDCVELPNGQRLDEYYVLEYPTWINVIAVTKEGRMVLVRQYRHALGRTGFEIVAGVVEKGEEPMVAAKRELLEETGFSGGEWRELMAVSANPGTMNNLTHCFLAEGVEHTDSQHLDVSEDIEVYEFSKQEVLDMLKKNEFMQSLMVAPLWKYFVESGSCQRVGASVNP
ncbi:MAG: NUDIX hydrolase [Prevotellaceae bacterium]|nr:NUDIX hydrolase [Prevotellaceae bacterium]MDY6131659.1 NUDIX hydrolase [Prevotella sp.]